MNNIKELIENKLACIDIENKHAKESKPNRLNYELNGMKQILYSMGFDLQMNVNPYFHENGEKSTYTLTLI